MPDKPDAAEAEAICRRVQCPVLVVHGKRDAIVPYQTGVALAEWTGAQLVSIEEGGHAPPFRDPVKTNLLLRDFVDTVTGRQSTPSTWTRARGRDKRALFLSSPIGLGHAHLLRRDLPELWRHLAACDLAVVQGGLTTTMELAAAARPFLYFPLSGHFEQQIHVPRRLANYRAGRRMDYATADPDTLAEAIAAEIGRDVDYHPVETTGAGTAADMLAELL